MGNIKNYKKFNYFFFFSHKTFLKIFSKLMSLKYLLTFLVIYNLQN